MSLLWVTSDVRGCTTGPQTFCSSKLFILGALWRGFNLTNLPFYIINWYFKNHRTWRRRTWVYSILWYWAFVASLVGLALAEGCTSVSICNSSFYCTNSDKWYPFHWCRCTRLVSWSLARATCFPSIYPDAGFPFCQSSIILWESILWKVGKVENKQKKPSIRLAGELTLECLDNYRSQWILGIILGIFFTEIIIRCILELIQTLNAPKKEKYIMYICQS